MRIPQRGYNKPQWGNGNGLYDLYDNPEHGLSQSLIMEYTDIAGIKVQVHVRSSKLEDYDRLYGEDNDYSLDSGLTTKLLYDVNEEPQVWADWGMWGTDTIITHIPKGTWERDISESNPPKIGDVISIEWYLDGSGRNFEVAHVDDDDKIFQLKKMIWILILKPYRHSEQSESADAITATPAVSAFGENDFIQNEGDLIFDYEDEGVDSSIYGY